jgi:hypothetical protein
MYCIIVKRGDFRTYDLLHSTFGQRAPIVWERRQADRRRPSGSANVDTERRQTQRRGPSPASWTAFNFVVVDRGK